MPLSGKRRKAAFTIMCRQLFCFQLKEKAPCICKVLLLMSALTYFPGRLPAKARLRALPAADTASKKSSAAV